ncbi:helix-turn-helix domain-containing protein [Brevundimonas sp.]|uniref:helix-turn-helix domain-containing protein n=1 Tax=Brevundimonas sp. TaxID=1871086 RepID=UPI002FC8AC87
MLGTAHRPGSESYAYAVNLMASGVSPQHASRMAGVHAPSLKSLAPRAAPRRSYCPASPVVAYGPPAPSKADRINHVLRVVAEKHGISVKALKGHRPSREYAWPRQEAMHELQQRFGLSTPHIGRILGGRDHTTVLYGIAKHKARALGEVSG